MKRAKGESVTMLVERYLGRTGISFQGPFDVDSMQTFPTQK